MRPPANNSGTLCVLGPDGTIAMRQSFVGLSTRCLAAAGHYLTSGPRAPGLAAITGQGAHRAFEAGCWGIIDGRRVDAGELTALAEDHLDRCLRGDVALDPDQPAERQISRARDGLVTTVQRFAAEVAPTLRPTDVERRIAVDAGDGISVSATLDLIQQGGVIEDFKTGRRVDDEQAQRSRQLTAQALGFRLLTGRMPAGLGLRRINAEGTSAHWTTRTEADLRTYLDVVRQVAACVRAGLFPPCGEGAWWCSARWCGWHAGVGGPCEYGR